MIAAPDSGLVASTNPGNRKARHLGRLRDQVDEFSAFLNTEFVHGFNHTVAVGVDPVAHRVVVTRDDAVRLDLRRVTAQLLVRELIGMVGVDIDPIEG